MTVASLSLFRFDGAFNRLWMIAQMGAARLAMPQERDARFWKLCGTGSGEGFTPRPNWDVWTIMATWPDEATARKRTAEGAVWKKWRARATESATIFVTPIASRGTWSGVNPFPAEPDPGKGPLVALTRASVKPAYARRFWSREPEISRRIGSNPDVMFKIGIGEVPLLHQVTFSVWPDEKTMAAFARGNTPHGQVIKSVREEHWFTEELYARFRVLGAEGVWEGRALQDRLFAARVKA